MKRFTPFIALLALVVMVGCSGDSPSAKPVPTVVPEAWSIVTLTASNTAPFVDTVILLDATVTKNGVAAPNGTSVNFLASGGAFSNGNTEASVLTSGGMASVAFLADTAGSYVIQAQVGGASRQVSVVYQDRSTTDALQLFSVEPRRGSYAGGDQVVITGKGILAPVEAYFDLNGVAYQAIVAGVTESIPASDNGFVTVVTPAFTGANNTIQQAADVRVVVNAGTGSSESDTLPSAFVLLPGGGPQIFGVSPNSGRSSGGEIVNILGQNFGSVASDLSVSFTAPDDQVRLGTVVSVAPDGSQIQVETPRFSTLPLTEDQPQDVTVSTVDGGTMLEDAFIVLADNPTPEIASISPTSGPLEGGTLVTIFGKGFQAPMQVFFGNLTATDVNIFDDTSPANQDRITCLSPNYSQQGDTPPVAVSVRVVNANTGAESVYDSFTYGDNLYISGNSPGEGEPGDLVIIYGSGFVSPLQVFYPSGSNQQMNVVSVSGTEIVIQIPEILDGICAGTQGSFKVVLLESNLDATGGNFKLRGNTPFVISVDPIYVNAGDDIVITGQNFADNVFVEIEGRRLDSNDVDPASSSRIDVFNIPSPTDLGIEFDPVSCTVGGFPGQRDGDTAVDVSVLNLPGECPDTLSNAIVYSPSGPNPCVLSPQINVTFGTGDFGSIPDGFCSAGPQVVAIGNPVPGTTLTVSTISVDSRFFLIAPEGSPGSTQAVGNVTIAGGAGNTVDIYFCPNAVGNFVGTLTIASDDPDPADALQTFNLSGTGS